MKTYSIIYTAYDEFGNASTKRMTIKTENDPEVEFWNVWGNDDIVINYILVKKNK
jgi:hypothetical protein